MLFREKGKGRTDAKMSVRVNKERAKWNFPVYGVCKV